MKIEKNKKTKVLFGRNNGFSYRFDNYLPINDNICQTEMKSPNLNSKFSYSFISSLKTIDDLGQKPTNNLLVIKKFINKKNNCEELQKLKIEDIFHELKTPLNAISAFCKLYKQSTRIEEKEGYVKNINKATKSILNLVNDTPELENKSSKSEQIDLKELILELSQIINSQLVEKKIDFKIIYDTNIPINFYGNRGLIYQVLLNVLTNAVKFTEFGNVTLYVGLDINNEQILNFNIKDTGIGLKNEELELIFNRYYRSPNTFIPKKTQGSGIGLSIVKKLLKSIKGSISVRSDYGIGSSFNIQIPTNLNIPQNQVRRVLIAEDNELSQLLLKNIFAKTDFEITIVNNGEKAIKYLENQNFDLVLLDLQMPVMNGFDTGNIIRNKLKLGIPIIALTAHLSDEISIKCYNSGINVCLNKVFEKEILFTVIDELLIENEFDFNYLDNVADGNLDFKKEIIELALNKIPLDFESLSEAILLKNNKSIISNIHKLKSSLMVLGINYDIILNKMEVEVYKNYRLVLENHFLLVYKFNQLKIKLQNQIL